MSSPLRSIFLECVAKGVGSRWKLVVNKIIVTKFLDSGPIKFKGSHNINSGVIGRILIGKIEFLSNLFQLSDINWSIINCARHLNSFFSANFGLLMSLWLLNMLFFRDWLSNSLWNLLRLYFTVDIDTSDWCDIFCGWQWFFLFDFRRLLLLNFWLDLYFWFDLCWNWGSLFNWLILTWWRDCRWLSWLYWLSWLCLLSGLGGLCLSWFFWLLFCAVSLLGRSSGRYLHTTSEKKIVHVPFEIGPLSVCIKGLLFVFYWFVIIINSKTPSNLRHFLDEVSNKKLIKI